MLNRVKIDDQCSDDFSYFEKPKSKLRKLSSASSSDIDCRLDPASTCSVERPNGTTRWILTVLQNSMSPDLFDRLLFLNIDRRLYGI